MSNFKSTVRKYVKGTDKNGKDLVNYRVDYSYIDPVTKERKRTCKRGFSLLREATKWQQEELPDLIRELEGIRPQIETMTMGEFVDIYLDDVEGDTCRITTLMNKQSIIENKILPYFKDMRVCEIKPLDIERWQKTLLKATCKNGKHLSPTYLHTILNQLNALLNHAVRLYDLPINPMYKVKKIGSKTPKNEPKFWTLEEYLTFVQTIKLNPIFYYAFQVLFWCGLRLGELLALTLDDIDFENATLNIRHSYQKINGEAYLSDTKTVNGIRKVYLPQRLVDELQDYTNGLYIKDNKTHIFPVSKSNMHNIMNKGCEECGVKRITIHGLRHSHISLLADMGITEAVIASRVGHKRQGITSHYTHPYEKSEKEVAFKLNELMEAM
ncbi:MAG: tyrosine-type recombinase/integrase [Eubacteriales bacterium]|nr:tyrosine-type recombinase/integrase [Eubacteriales bacterium]